jgi:hypothetical protein
LSEDPLEFQRYNNSLKISSMERNQTEESTQTKPLLMVLQSKEEFSEESNLMPPRIFF